MPFSVGCKYGSLFLGARLRLFLLPLPLYTHVTNTLPLLRLLEGGQRNNTPCAFSPLGAPGTPAHAAPLPLCSGSGRSDMRPTRRPTQPACWQHHFPEDHVCLPPSLCLCPTQSVGCYASLLASWHARGGHGGHLHIISDMRMAISGTRFPLNFLSSLFPFKFI